MCQQHEMARIFFISKGICFSIFNARIQIYFLLREQNDRIHSIVSVNDNLLIRITSKQFVIFTIVTLSNKCRYDLHFSNN